MGHYELRRIMMNSKKWWSTVKKDEFKFNNWLQKQYFGELKASERIAQLVSKYKLKEKDANILNIIAFQESQHAQWVLELLEAREVKPLNDHVERYWSETGLEFESADEAFAVAAHAEGMRLERIRAIVEDTESPSDVKEVFTKILKDEEFHERAFRELTSEAQYELSRNNHEKGLKALGLTL